ncbi:MAG TPA: site-2 protease family protein [Ktedonobacteraceae bacterium]|nr:site-2 protease family protein [Ktedonobacteraceae bacterium]
MIDVVLALMLMASFIVAVMLHECGHALMALMLGDRTPLNEGRLSLSPRIQIDPIGILMCVILAFQPVPGATAFGWGKPVKPDPWKLRTGPNAGVLLVAFAGIIFSALIGVVAAVILRFLPAILYSNDYLVRIPQFVLVFATVNFCLAIFNFIPLYPLDGYEIVYTLLPERQAKQFARSAPYGPFIILAIFFLLPFLARLANLSTFPLFDLPYYITLGAWNLVSLVVHTDPSTVMSLYLFGL